MKLSVQILTQNLMVQFDIDWQEIKEKHHVQCASDTIRKSSSTPFGGRFRDAYFRSKQKSGNDEKSEDQLLYEKNCFSEPEMSYTKRFI